MTLEELMQKAHVTHSADQLELLKQKIVYEKNESEWQSILQNVIYAE